MTKKISRIIVTEQDGNDRTWIILKSGLFEEYEGSRLFDEDELALLKKALDNYYENKGMTE